MKLCKTYGRSSSSETVALADRTTSTGISTDIKISADLVNRKVHSRPIVMRGQLPPADGVRPLVGAVALLIFVPCHDQVAEREGKWRRQLTIVVTGEEAHRARR
jgi:hypothetical protein